MALTNRRPTAGLVHHSDRGSTYASGDYRTALEARRIQWGTGGAHSAMRADGHTQGLLN
jgi:transposase InsO family protein